MKEYTILPLINSAFEAGQAKETVAAIEDSDLQQIAQAELYYFTGQAQDCSRIAAAYLMDSRMEIKLSACVLYTYANLTLGNASASQQGLQEIQLCLKRELQSPSSSKNKAFCIFISYLSAVLLHNPIDGLPDFQLYVSELSQGIKIFAAYIMAHGVYLKGDYARALGICQTALLFQDGSYLISTIYLYCMIAMCHINLKNQQEARNALLTAWNMAKEDSLLEPFIEHHGLLQGLLESCVRKENPEIYKDLSERVIAFSRGWMRIHDISHGHQVTDALSTMEFSIAMLASRGWSNKAIGQHLDLTENTVKHYLSAIYEKLGIKKRDELKNYLLQ